MKRYKIIVPVVLEAEAIIDASDNASQEEICRIAKELHESSFTLDYDSMELNINDLEYQEIHRVISLDSFKRNKAREKLIKKLDENGFLE